MANAATPSRWTWFLTGYVCGAVVATVIAEILVLHGITP